MAASTEGLKSGLLGANLLLAETATFGDGGVYVPLLWLTSSVAAVIEFQHRNSTNTGNVWAHRFYVTAASPLATVSSEDAGIAVNSGERFRLVLIVGLIGDVQGTMFT
jgi:hypothetical protein